MALLIIVNEPVTLPVAVGVNVAVRLTVSEGFRVAGADIPATVMPVPCTVMAETFTAAFPLFVNTIC